MDRTYLYIIKSIILSLEDGHSNCFLDVKKPLDLNLRKASIPLWLFCCIFVFIYFLMVYNREKEGGGVSLTPKEKVPTNELLKPVRSLIESGKNEEAFHALSLFYVYALGELFDNHISIPFTMSNHQLDMTRDDEERIKEYYHKSAAATSAEQKRHYLEALGKLLSTITNDSFFEESVQMQRRQLKGFVSNFSDSYSSTRSSKTNFNRTKFSPKLRSEAFPDEYSTGDAAIILGVSKETVRRMCEHGRFPEAHKTDGGHWRIPSKYFNMTANEANKANQLLKPLDRKTKEQLGEHIDDLDILIDKS
jgi:excisionase family DNA binding protein